MWKLTFMGDFMDIISMSYFVELSHVNMNNYIFFAFTSTDGRSVSEKGHRLCALLRKLVLIVAESKT